MTWIKLKDFPDYEMNDNLEVRSLKFGKIKMLKAQRDKYGNSRVILSRGGVSTVLSTAQLRSQLCDDIKTSSNIESQYTVTLNGRPLSFSDEDLMFRYITSIITASDCVMGSINIQMKKVDA